MQKSLTLAVLMTLLTSPISAHATGLYSCEPTDRAQWLTQAELTEQLETLGWSVRRMKEDGGCWEVYGTTPEWSARRRIFPPDHWRCPINCATRAHPISRG